MPGATGRENRIRASEAPRTARAATPGTYRAPAEALTVSAHRGFTRAISLAISFPRHVGGNDVDPSEVFELDGGASKIVYDN